MKPFVILIPFAFLPFLAGCSARDGAEKEHDKIIADLRELGLSVDVGAEGRGTVYGNLKVTDTGLLQLKRLKNLHWVRQVRILNSEVTDNGLAFLDDFTELELLALISTKVTGTGLVHIKDQKGLKRLNLSASPVTDEGLVHLKNLSGLHRLDLDLTEVTGPGLVHIKGLTRLEELQIDSPLYLKFHGNTGKGEDVKTCLHYGTLMDAGMVHLKDLKGLRKLGLSGSRVSDEGLVHLKGLKELEELYLVASYASINYDMMLVTDAGLAHLNELIGLKKLDLSNNHGITDAGVAHLKDLTNLEELSLAGTRVTNAGLVHLYGLAKLRKLYIGGRWSERRPTAELKKTMPLVEIRNENTGNMYLPP